MRLSTKIGLGAATALAVLAPAVPALAWPDNVVVTQTSNQTGAYYYGGSGSVRAWQYCETPSGQTDWYSYGPWQGSQWTYSWTGTCTIIRDRGFDVRNY